MRMKLAKSFCMVALLAVSAAAVEAGSIKNDDPKVVIQKPGGGTGAANPGFNSFGQKSGLDPMIALVYNGNSPLYTLTITESPTGPMEQWANFSNIYDGFASYADMSTLVVTFSGKSYPAGSQCGDGKGLKNVGCPGVITKGETIDIFVTFDNMSQTGTISVPMNFSCANGKQTCSDGNLTVDANQPIPTPEPSTMLLFFSLGPAIGFAKKRWNARQSA
jgi:hypothetical protein